MVGHMIRLHSWDYCTLPSLATVSLEGQTITKMEKVLRISAPVHAFCILTGKHATSYIILGDKIKRLNEINLNTPKILLVFNLIIITHMYYL